MSKNKDELDYLLIEAEFGLRKEDTANGRPLLDHPSTALAVDKFLESDRAKNYRSAVRKSNKALLQRVREAITVDIPNPNNLGDGIGMVLGIRRNMTAVELQERQRKALDELEGEL